MAARRIPLFDPRVAVRPRASTTFRRAQSSGSAGAIQDWSAPGSVTS